MINCFSRRRIFALALMWAFAGASVAQDRVEVVMKTSLGDLHISLDTAGAPVTTANFLRYVDGKHYDGATFYRTVRDENDNGSPKIEVIQGGLRDAEQPFSPIEHEDTERTGILHTDGVISMARGDVGTASSEFFICIGDQPGLDKGQPRNPDKQGFAAFGKVVAGMDVVTKIHASPSNAEGYSTYVAGQIIEDPVVINSVRRATPPP